MSTNSWAGGATHTPFRCVSVEKLKKTDSLTVRIVTTLLTLMISGLTSFAPTLLKHYSYRQMGHGDNASPFGKWIVRQASENIAVPMFVNIFGNVLILATGMVHMLPQASTLLTNRCLSVSFYQFPELANLLAISAAFACAGVTALINSKRSRSVSPTTSVSTGSLDSDKSHYNVHQNELEKTLSPASILSHFRFPQKNDIEKDTLSITEAPSPTGTRFRFTEADFNAAVAVADEISRREIFTIILLVTAGMFHNFVIGMNISLARDDTYIKVYISALIYAAAEGLAIGNRLVLLYDDSLLKPALGSLAYAIAMPLGMMLGLILRNKAEGMSQPTGVLIMGLLNAFGAGIMIYIGARLVFGKLFLSSGFSGMCTSYRVTAVTAAIAGVAFSVGMAIIHTKARDMDPLHEYIQSLTVGKQNAPPPAGPPPRF